MKLTHAFSAALLASSAAAAGTPTLDARALPTYTSRPPTLLEASDYPPMRRYTLFSSAAGYYFYFNSCERPPYGTTVVSTIDIDSTDTQALIFRDDAAKEYIVAFPGTSSSEDFDTNFNATLVPYISPGLTSSNCRDCRVHGGFLLAYNSIAPSIQRDLDNYRRRNPSYKIAVTGHSLGGALAALSWTSLKTLNYPVTTCYTFGQPRVWNGQGADYVDRLAGATVDNKGSLRRVTHDTDGVPSLPPPGGSTNFTHTRNEFWQLNDRFGNQTARTILRCYGRDDTRCNRAVARGFIEPPHLLYTGFNMTSATSCGE